MGLDMIPIVAIHRLEVGTAYHLAKNLITTILDARGREAGLGAAIGKKTTIAMNSVLGNTYTSMQNLGLGAFESGDANEVYSSDSSTSIFLSYDLY